MVDTIKCLCSLWRNVASNIGLSEENVESISQQHPTDDLKCLSEVIKMWLRKDYDWEKYGCPSWKMLARAVIHMNDIASEIAHQHKGNCVIVACKEVSSWPIHSLISCSYQKTHRLS